jgi:ankyrin repeat protein
MQNGWSVLHAAAEVGDLRIMALLLERGADVHTTSKVLHRQLIAEG